MFCAYSFILYRFFHYTMIYAIGNVISYKKSTVIY